MQKLLPLSIAAASAFISGGQFAVTIVVFTLIASFTILNWGFLSYVHQFYR